MVVAAAHLGDRTAAGVGDPQHGFGRAVHLIDVQAAGEQPLLPQLVEGLVVAEARARYADFATGRNCRPSNSNERLAVDTGYSVRTIAGHDVQARTARDIAAQTPDREQLPERVQSLLARRADGVRSRGRAYRHWIDAT